MLLCQESRGREKSAIKNSCRIENFDAATVLSQHGLCCLSDEYEELLVPLFTIIVQEFRFTSNQNEEQFFLSNHCGFACSLIATILI